MKIRARFSLAGLMVMIAIVAVGLNECGRRLRQYRATMIRGAIVVSARFRPDQNLRGWDGNLGRSSADGEYQQVVFARSGVKDPVTVTVRLGDATRSLKVLGRPPIASPAPRTPQSNASGRSGNPPIKTP